MSECRPEALGLLQLSPDTLEGTNEGSDVGFGESFCTSTKTAQVKPPWAELKMQILDLKAAIGWGLEHLIKLSHTDAV